MRSKLTVSNLGIALAILSPFFALSLGGLEAFLPVALVSVLSATICLIGESISTHLFVGHLTAELVQDLVSADEERLDLVLAELNETERDWFLAELPRAQAELRRRQWQPQTGYRAGARWGWRLRVLNELA
ncbi:MAG: hypothetical protein ACLPRE_00505 [Limisphaerales bacterium]